MKKKVFIVVGILLFLVLFVVSFFLYKNFFGPQKPGKCLVLDDRYCKQLKLENESEIIYKIVGKMPIGTKVFAPVDGDCSDSFTVVRSETEKLGGVSIDLVLVKDAKKANYTLLFNGGNCNKTVKKGDLVGEVKNNNFEVLVEVTNMDVSVFEMANFDLAKGLLGNLLKR